MIRRKNRKKIFIGLFLFQAFFGVFALIAVEDVSSFKNGFVANTPESKFSGNVKKNIPYWDILTSSGRNWHEFRYGTHDWIGDGALNAIEAEANWLYNNEIFWTLRRKWIFLVGTEALDAGENKLSIELDGNMYYGMKVINKAYFYPYDLTGDLEQFRMHPKLGWFEMSLTNTVRLTHFVKTALLNEECDTAAFFMGALCHLIGDMATFTHLTEKTNAKLDARYEDHILTHTHDYMFPERVFDYPEYYEFNFDTRRSPVEIFLETAFFTRWNRHADWMDIIAIPKPETLQPGSFNADDLVDDLNSVPNGRGYSSYPARLKGAVQSHLKEAVLASADMINYFKLYWTGECGDDEGVQRVDPQSPKPPAVIGRDLTTSMMFMLSIGLSSILLSPVFQAMTKKIFN
jgi:hypothetical protein